MKKSFWLAMLAYLLPTFPLGYAWHLVTFKAAYDRLDLYRAEVIIPFGLASMLLQAAIFACTYPNLFSTPRDDSLASATLFFWHLCNACLFILDIVCRVQIPDDLGD